MSAKHTPGPWLSAAGPSSIVGWPVVGSGGRSIASLTWWPREHFQPDVTDEAYDALVAEIGANGRLIAAAPDLLAALLAILTMEDDFGNPPDTIGGFSGVSVTEIKANARLAISKALGPDQ